MKVVVLAKQVKHVYAQTGTDPKGNFIGPDDIVRIINPLDELALEEALRIKERNGDTEVTVISLGDGSAEDGLRKCLSMGADKAIHIYDEDYGELDAWMTATALAYSIRDRDFKLILGGRRAIDDNGGLVGPYVAEILGIPHVSGVVKLELDGEGEGVLVHRAVERGNREVMECSIPALFTVEKGINVPRYPTLPGILRAENQPIERVEIEDLNLPLKPFGPARNLTETISLSNPKPKKRSGGLADAALSASDRLRLVMGGGDTETKGESTLVEGGTDEALSEIERVLRESGILPE
jgi:electron transfer flavoprotein beta subunit